MNKVAIGLLIFALILLIPIGLYYNGELALDKSYLYSLILSASLSVCISIALLIE